MPPSRRGPRTFGEYANLKRYVTTPANLNHNSNAVMTSTEISHVALQSCAQFKFCRCSIACEISLRIFLDSASKATHLMLRHAIDVEAESRTRYKALSKYFVLKIKGRVSEARVKPTDGYHFTLKASRGANRRRNPAKILPLDRSGAHFPVADNERPGK
jgi:hypothetical protein